MHKPQPRYGWHGQSSLGATAKFPVGTKVWVTGGFGVSPSSILAEVMPLDTPPADLSQHSDLVKLRIIDAKSLSGLYPPRTEDYWQEWQLEKVDDD